MTRKKAYEIYNRKRRAIDIRDKVQENMIVKLWVTRSSEYWTGGIPFKNINDGWYLVDAVINFNRVNMCWTITPDKKQLQDIAKPKGKEKNEANCPAVFYNDDINPFNRVYSIISYDGE